MANLDVHLHSVPREDAPALPRVNTITTADLRHALRLGWEDFKAQPSHLAFVALMYPVIGVLLARAAARSALHTTCRTSLDGNPCSVV